MSRYTCQFRDAGEAEFQNGYYHTDDLRQASKYAAAVVIRLDYVAEGRVVNDENKKIMFIAKKENQE
jgi:hypothetical protein